jgi:hypothetical protein
MPCPRRPESGGCLRTVPERMAPPRGRTSPVRRTRSHHIRSRNAVRSGGTVELKEIGWTLTPTAPPTGESCRFEPKRGGADDQRRLLAA